MNAISLFIRLMRRICLAAVSVLFAMSIAHADIVVPTGAIVNASASTIDFACTDLIVSGTFNLGTGSLVNVRDVVIQPGGGVSATTGSIALARNWSNLGSFAPSTGTVAFVDNPSCAVASSITGNSSFYNLSLTSTSGRVITLAQGATQTVLGSLTVTGTAAAPIQVISSSAMPAFINLSGSQVISNVGVNNVTASGQWLAIGQTNKIVGGIAPNWFGDGPVIPTLSGFALFLLAIFVSFLTFFRDSRSRRTQSGRGSL